MTADSSNRLAVPSGYSTHGHAIVSADDVITDAEGKTPSALRNKADWRRFQAALRQAAVTLLGRSGHEIHRNPDRRPRIVVSGAVVELERRGEAVFWNPAASAFGEALAAAAPEGGVVAVVGGQRVFDLFLAIGYDEFHLARATRVVIGDGQRLFAALGPDLGAERALTAAGLKPAPVETLDAEAAVTLTVFRK